MTEFVAFWLLVSFVHSGPHVQVHNRLHMGTMGLEGGIFAKGGEVRYAGGGGEIFEDDEISVKKFRFIPQIFGAISYGRNSPRWQLHAICSGHSCRRSVQEFAHLICLVPSTGSCSQFCLILTSSFPPTLCLRLQFFGKAWRTSFVVFFMDEKEDEAEKASESVACVIKRNACLSL